MGPIHNPQAHTLLSIFVRDTSNSCFVTISRLRGETRLVGPLSQANCETPTRRRRRRNAKIFRCGVSFFCSMVVDPMPPSSKNQGPLVGFALIAIGTKWALNVADHDFVKFDQQLVLFEEIASKTVKTITRGTMRRHMVYFLKIFLFGVLLRVILQAEGVL